MKKFKQILNESKFNHTFTFGRFNPPTIGHEKLIEKVAKTASGSKDYSIYVSQSQSPAKDPLPYALKIAYMRKIFKKYARNIVADTKVRNVFDIATKLHGQGVKNITMIAGSDRVKEFERLLESYNGVEGKRHGYYKFDSIKVISAGERDPDAEGVEGMSASKMRAAASANSFDVFKQGIASDEATARKLFNDVRKYMGIREEREMGDMDDYETLRDMYLTGKIWLVGEMIEANGIEGKIISRGTNYITFNDKDGKVHKAWLTEVRNYRKEYDNYHSRPEQIQRRAGRNKAARLLGTKDGMDVHHKDNNPLNNDPSNLEHMDKSENRREPRLRDEQKKITKTKQEKGKVGDVKGTQPAKYYAKDAGGKGMSKATQLARARHFAKGGSAEKAPGDAGAKTKPSQYTKKFKQMYGEAKEFSKSDELEMLKLFNKGMKAPSGSPKQKEIIKQINKIRTKYGMSPMKEKLGKDADAGDYIDDFMKSDAPQFKGKSKEKKRDMAIAAYLDAKDKNEEVLDEKIAGLVKKSKQTGVPYGILKKSYDRGMAAWKGGHRPGTTPQQWAFARVNSMLTGGKADPDLQGKVRAAKKAHKAKKKESYEIGTDEYTDHTKKVTPGQIKEWFESQVVRANYELKFGEDWWWKLNEVHDAMLEKIGADCCDDCGEELNEKSADFIRLTFNSPADVKKAKKWMDENLPSANQGFTGVDYSNKDIEFEDVDDADGLMSKLKRAGFRFKIDHREEFDESLWANIHKKRQRIKQGSGERMRKKGEKGAPTPAQMKRAKGEEVDDLDERSVLKRDKKLPNLMVRKKGKAGVTKFDRKAGVRDAGRRRLAASFHNFEQLNDWGEIVEDAEYQGRKVKLNNPTRGDVKKYKVYVKNDKGNVVKVEFGDPNMDIKRDDPARRKSFRARHNCDNPGPKFKARYWSCKFWSAKSVTDLMKG